MMRLTRRGQAMRRAGVRHLDNTMKVDKFKEITGDDEKQKKSVARCMG